MTTDFVVHVRTMVPPENDLGQIGDTEGPVIDAIRNALSRFNISLDKARYQPAPRIYPPWYIVFARASADINIDDFKNALNEVWSGTVDREGNKVPDANIEVGDQNE